MAMKETIEEKLDRFIHVGWRDKTLQNGHGIGKINIAGHAFHVPHRFQKLVIDTALKDSPQLFHFTADDIKIPALGLDLSQRRVLAPTGHNIIILFLIIPDQLPASLGDMISRRRTDQSTMFLSRNKVKARK